MTYRIWLGLLMLVAATSHGSGISLSTVKEVAEQAKSIYAVKVTKVTKPKEPYSGTKGYPIALEFELIETIKGAPISSRRAVYTLPAIQRKMPDGTIMGVWLKTLASGEEEGVTVGKQYLIYSGSVDPKSKASFHLMRIESISKKAELLKVLEAIDQREE